MIVGYLDIERVAVDPAKADSPLIVDGDGVLPSAITCEPVESVSLRNTKILQTSGHMYVFKLAPCASHDVGRKPPRPAGFVEFLRLPI